MRTKLLLVLSLMTFYSQGQIVNLSYIKNDATDYDLKMRSKGAKDEDDKQKSYEFFSGGNIDYISGGLIQANTQLFKINIGEPKKFYMPFYVVVGADKETGSDTDADANKSTSVNLLSANGGYLNLGLHGNWSPKWLSFGDYSKISLVYQLGAKSIIGNDMVTNERVNLFSGIGNVGFLLQTAAWNPDDIENIGMAWVQCAFSNTLNDNEKIKKIYGENVNRHFYGLNVEAGVEIEKYINLRFGYYSYFNNNDINDEFKDGIMKFSVDFKI
ncbi:hypothetical protein [Flavobacterium sp.]|uniref:hypothetical protein n=1 Tax=Flavobacterium sp. TaxID=239 RepID=UPI002B4B1812|nr:hypothetical protein [Flavobacterium sp.]HLP64741.1 hypothetical protein [Flavobacterium sp.]